MTSSEASLDSNTSLIPPARSWKDLDEGEPFVSWEEPEGTVKVSFSPYEERCLLNLEVCHRVREGLLRCPHSFTSLLHCFCHG